MASLAIRSGLLGRRLAAHLLRRTTFGPTREEIDYFSQKTVDQAVDELLNFPALPDHPKDPLTQAVWVVDGHNGINSPNDELKHIINAWWLHQVFDPALPTTAFLKMAFFLHTSFSTHYGDIEWNEHHYYTLRLQLFFAGGSYKDFARKMCLDNGMNDYQNIGDSFAGNPNENFARELLELFTIGKGPQIGPGDYTNYTELDVTEAARLLTGFRRNDVLNDPLLNDPDTGFPNAQPDVSSHDDTDKIFSHAFQNQVILGRNTEAGMLEEMDDLIEMIFAQDATAVTLCRRLYRFFVNYHISQEAEQDIIQPLAVILRGQNFTLKEALRVLLKSVHFYDEDDSDASDETIGSLIKSPLEIQAGILRFFKIPIPDPEQDLFHAYVTFYRWGLIEWLKKTCLELFAPPEVAGYPPVHQAPIYNRLWVSAHSLPYRYQMVDEHLIGVSHLQMDLLSWISDPANLPDFQGQDPLGIQGPHQGARIASHIVSELLKYLIPETVSQDRFDYFLHDLFLDNVTEGYWSEEWDNYLLSSDDSIVKPLIHKLVRGILQSPEYQCG